MNNMKRMRNLVVSTLLVTSILGNSQIVFANDGNSITRITTQQVPLKTEPTYSESTIKGWIIGAEELEVLKVEQDFAYVNYKGQEGYVARRYLKYPVRFTKANLNLREKPNGGILKTMPIGSEVLILEHASDGWYKVMYKGQEGYCSKEFLTTRQIIATATTYFSSNAARKNNIEVSGKAIEGIVQKDEVFSFLEKIGGESTAEQGYQMAGVLVNGKPAQGMGGGLCQTSTTLYLALQQIESIEIVERHTHSASVGYVPVGKDATIWYPNKDLKFIPRDCAIEIQSIVTDTSVTINVYKK